MFDLSSCTSRSSISRSERRSWWPAARTSPRPPGCRSRRARVADWEAARHGRATWTVGWPRGALRAAALPSASRSAPLDLFATTSGVRSRRLCDEVIVPGRGACGRPGSVRWWTRPTAIQVEAGRSVRRRRPRCIAPNVPAMQPAAQGSRPLTTAAVIGLARVEVDPRARRACLPHSGAARGSPRAAR